MTVISPITLNTTEPRPALVLAVFAVFALLMFPAHESAHYITYRALGIHLQMTLNTASPSDAALRRPVAEIAGPVFNLVVAALTALLFLKTSARAWWQRELGLAACLMRLDIYALILIASLITGSGMSLGNDEPIAARQWGLPSLVLVFVLLVPFLWIAAAVTRSAWRTRSSRAAQFVIRAIIMFAIGILIGSVLDPWLFSRH
jgi:uncharacterized membrane protein